MVLTSLVSYAKPTFHSFSVSIAFFWYVSYAKPIFHAFSVSIVFFWQGEIFSHFVKYTSLSITLKYLEVWSLDDWQNSRICLRSYVAWIWNTGKFCSFYSKVFEQTIAFSSEKAEIKLGCPSFIILFKVHGILPE